MCVRWRLGVAFLVPALVVACADPGRAPGTRAPLTATCDDADPIRCVLPWPSNTFAVADPATATGLRVQVSPEAIPDVGDDPTVLSIADGFSRLSPIATAFPKQLDPASLGGPRGGAVRLYVAQPGDTFGQEIPLRFEQVTGADDNVLLLAYPLRPLAPASDHVVVVTDALRAADGTGFEADRVARLTVGVEAAKTESERARVAYHAPLRTLLDEVDIAPGSVIRAWDFTTRSLEDPLRRLKAMRAAAEASTAEAGVTVAIDSVKVPGEDSSIAVIVEGRLRGLPDFRSEEFGPLATDDAGTPKRTGVHDAPFRAALPKGEGDYRVVMYGHGTGGNFHDDLFEEQLTAAGLAKVGVQYIGWTDADVIITFGSFERMLQGVDRSTAGLLQSLADLAAIEKALAGKLGEALAATTLGPVENPVAGRRPDMTEPFWAGGSLGGTMGLVHASASPAIRYAVLNVPGAAWTHFTPQAMTFKDIEPLVNGRYKDPLDLRVGVAMSQISWDDVDGGNWVDDIHADGSVYLLQQSMGDPVLPNIGSEFAAAALGAAQVGTVLSPIVDAPTATEVVGASAITQFRTNATSALGIHGFAGRSGIAGDAARAQIDAFMRSALDGTPRITVPALCVENGDTCDFSQ